MTRDEPRRVVAECERCGAAYAAEQWPDGTIRVIGRSGCRCGRAAFVAMNANDDSPETTSD